MKIIYKSKYENPWRSSFDSGDLEIFKVKIKIKRFSKQSEFVSYVELVYRI